MSGAIINQLPFAMMPADPSLVGASFGPCAGNFLVLLRVRNGRIRELPLGTEYALSYAMKLLTPAVIKEVLLLQDAGGGSGCGWF